MKYVINSIKNDHFTRLSAVSHFENIVVPETFDCLSFERVENPLALDCIAHESPIKYLLICQLYLAMPIFTVILELAFVVYPLVSQSCKIATVERFRSALRSIVIESTFSIELVVLPRPFIS